MHRSSISIQERPAHITLPASRPLTVSGGGTAGGAAGGVVAGALVQNFGHNGVFLFAFVMFLLWFLVALSMSSPVSYKTLTVDLKDIAQHQREDFLQQCHGLQGVADITVISEQQIAYIKTDRALFKTKKFNQLQIDFIG